MRYEKMIMKGIVFVLIILFFVGFVSTNTSSKASISTEIPMKQWEKTYGDPTDDLAASVIQTSDGGYIIAGSSEFHCATFC